MTVLSYYLTLFYILLDNILIAASIHDSYPKVGRCKIIGYIPSHKMITPDQAAAKFAANLSASTTAISNGVKAVTTAPTSQAAAAVSKWQSKMSLPTTAQRFVNGLNGVSLQDWQNAMLNKGLSRIASGAQNAVPKMTTFYQSFLPFLATVQSKVRSMPSLTLQDNIQRMVTNVTEISKYTKS